MATSKILPYPPVRPMDPEYISKFLSSSDKLKSNKDLSKSGKDMSKKMISGFVKALNNYNKACGIAVANLEKELNALLKL